MDTYYKATTIFYPSNQDLSKPELIFGGTIKVTEYFGTDKDVDRILEIAASNELVDYMIGRFGLFNHYGIDSASHEGRYWARLRFRDLYVVQKNRNDAIELTIEDTDPQLASDMANAAREKIDEFAQRLTKDSQAKLLASFDSNLKRKDSRAITAWRLSVRIVQNQLQNLRRGRTRRTSSPEQLTRAEEDIARNTATPRRCWMEIRSYHSIPSNTSKPTCAVRCANARCCSLQVSKAATSPYATTTKESGQSP
jgi:hypothetical protein